MQSPLEQAPEILDSIGMDLSIHVLDGMIQRKSSFARVITLLEPLLQHRNPKTRDFASSVLLLLGDHSKAAIDYHFKTGHRETA